ncbi:hypothetical protein ACTWPB_27105 [Nocardia sp. IBHARD005]|uniref:hypothetical protein n=1 Tax=Nocardia sp. IBHARD005 TaxID=3457765 RepID=UPI004058C3AA
MFAITIVGACVTLVALYRPTDPIPAAATTMPPGKTAAPTVLALTLSDAELQEFRSFDVSDIANDVLGNGRRSRMVLESSNWQIVAQCPYLVSGKIKVGVVKHDETFWILDRSIARNKFSTFLKC